ncbi:MAG: hypothetical protein LBC37_02790 [Zoogloeaceae bacterium]|jgi:hypothetical protein|nr:hypothetical protein [Zoogloeaceae bacterium]
MNDAKLALLVSTLVVAVAAPIVASVMRARSRAKNGESVPEEQYNALITDVNALRPGDPPLDVPAKADNNIMRITEDYLFARTVSGRMYGGRASMSWWAAFMEVIVLLLSFIFLIDHWDEEGFRFFLFFNLFWCVAASWIFIGWRRQLPIIFNRKARTVTCWLGKRLYTRNWDEIKAYSKGGIVVTYGGGGGREGHLHLVMDCCFNPKKKRMEETCVNIYETEMRTGNYSASQRAEMVWEYIRLYMDKGPAALPPFDDSYDSYGLDRVSEAFTIWGKCIRDLLETFSPKQMVKDIVEPFRNEGFFGGVVNVIISLFFMALMILIGIPFSLLFIPTDLLYMALDRILPRRKWPKELLEACNYAWDGSKDYGPISKPALKAFDFNAARKAQPLPEAMA